MEKEVSLYKLIYNKIVNRILIGMYPKGFQLSSMEKIRDEFGIGLTSIRRAMRLLQEDGFLQMEERKRPVVIFDPTDERCLSVRRRLFLSHYRSNLDCYQAIPYIVPGLVLHGATKATPQLLDDLHLFLQTKSPKDLTVRSDLLNLAYDWMAMVIHQRSNGLADDLFVQIHGFDELRFVEMPSRPLVKGEAEMTLETLRHWTALLAEQAYDELHFWISMFCKQAMCEIEHSFAPLAELEELNQVRQVDFRWYIHQTPTPLYNKIAYELVRNIHFSRIHPGDLLPSETILMKQYGVSIVTIRSSLAFLNTLHLTQTMNGIGTVYAAGKPENANIAEYLLDCCNSIDIMASCAQSIAAAAAEHYSMAQLYAFELELEENRESNDIVEWMLAQFVKTLGIQSLETIVDQLEVRYLFGLYLSGILTSENWDIRKKEIYEQAKHSIQLWKYQGKEAFAAKFGEISREWAKELCREISQLPSFTR